MPTRLLRLVLTAFAVSSVAAACGSGASPAPRSGDPATSGDAPPTIAVRAVDYAFQPSSITTTAGRVTFEIANGGLETHEFEIFEGDQVVDEVENLVPGLTRSLTVTLETGDYTFVCKLADHEQRGMTGTLTVTPG